MKETVKTSQNKKKKPKKTAHKRKKNPKKRSDAIKTFLLAGLFVILAVCISLIIVLFNNNSKQYNLTEEPKPEIPQITDIETDPNTATAVTPEQRQTLPDSAVPQVVGTSGEDFRNSASAVVNSATRHVENLGNLVFVIDDAGNNLWELEPFLHIPDPLTIAVLPGLPYSAEAARRIRAAGKEVILHQPMEAVGGQNPGPGAIYSGMSEDEIKAVLLKNIAEVGPIAGMNNHQGSKITMDKETMKIILAFCAEHDLYFLDSRTTAETAAPAAAALLGIKIAERDVFIDNEQDRNAMLRYITDGLAKAQKNGYAAMIGHVWSPELAPLLDEQFSLLKNQGYTLTTASAIIK